MFDKNSAIIVTSHFDIYHNEWVEVSALITDSLNSFKDGKYSNLCVNIYANHKSSCNWAYDHNNGVYETSCDKSFIIIDGYPFENDMKYCCYCGKPLIEADNHIK